MLLLAGLSASALDEELQNRNTGRIRNEVPALSQKGVARLPAAGTVSNHCV